ncbi:ATPase associated with various cellular activities family protein [Mycobacterium ulcerans str. Harvey]|uniref:ATPase associated with various cellular activities family protein n=1 Tax=Mycobacterium ulcerans str. Harvey TaxID=1299332 RepID=A0ABN0QY42_MYCUL|nr:ATPase associated with various cellular activities family protein [Mycobacterium ulcerans str. Harvey]
MWEKLSGQGRFGELGASFYQVGIADVLHRWFGDSERSIRAVFDNARRNAPCVLFFDEVDALGHRRSALSGSAGLRTVVNSILEELDSAASSNDGVYVLGRPMRPGTSTRRCVGPAVSIG